MKLYVFNPDADMALGNNEENYMAPATIRRMAEMCIRDSPNVARMNGGAR